MNIKHVVVTRLALKWRFNETKLNWDSWLKNSVELMDLFCRPSLRNQTNQNFMLLSLVDESVDYFGNILENETIIKVSSKNNEYPKQEMIQKINNYLNEFDDVDAVILTRLDRDDCLHYKFLERVWEYLKDGDEKYVDLNYSLTYDLSKKIAYNSKKYYHTFVSPFVSTCEKIKKGNLRCISLLVDHNHVPQHLNGKKVNDLFAMQVIHENNLKNKIYGERIEINMNEYGFR